MSWLSPSPPDAPLIQPRQTPKVVAASFIGNSEQVLSLLMHHGFGSLVRDYSRSGNHGLLGGGVAAQMPIWVDGMWGWALGFDGADDLISVADSVSIRNLPAWTRSVWIYPTGWGDSTAPRLMSKPATEQLLWYLSNLVDANTALRSTRIVRAAATTSAHSSGVTDTIVLNLWQLLQVTYDDAGARLIRIYRNAVEVTYKTQVAAVGALTDDTGDLLLGNRPAVDRSYQGLMLFPSLWSRVLTAAELQSYFNATCGLFGV